MSPESHGAAAVPCLSERFDDSQGLVYHQGEANTQSKSLGWTIGDLAAGFAAAILEDDSYNPLAAAPERKLQRDALRQRRDGKKS